jgi:hypothetical protein
MSLISSACFEILDKQRLSCSTFQIATQLFVFFAADFSARITCFQDLERGFAIFSPPCLVELWSPPEGIRDGTDNSKSEN